MSSYKKSNSYIEEDGETEIDYKLSCGDADRTKEEAVIKKISTFSKNSNKKENYSEYEKKISNEYETTSGKITNDDGFGNKSHTNWGNQTNIKTREKISEFCDRTEDISCLNQKLVTKKGK